MSKLGQKYVINKQGYGLDRKGTWKCSKNCSKNKIIELAANGC